MGPRYLFTGEQRRGRNHFLTPSLLAFAHSDLILTMRAYAKEIGLGLLILVCLGYLAIHLLRSGKQNVAVDEKGRDCGHLHTTLKMQDDWMGEELPKDKEFKVLVDWKGCHNLQKGDLVLYRISPSHDPVAREVVALGGDRFKLVKDKNGNSWNIEINGEIRMEGKKPYHFGSANPPALRLYETSHKGELLNGDLLLFSKRSPGEQDSGSLGVLNERDLVGVVTLSH